MKVIRHSDADFPSQLEELTASSSLFDPEIEQRSRAILEAVRSRGDDALLEFTERFDGAKLGLDQLPITQAELVTASLKADNSLRSAVAEAEKNIARFAAIGNRQTRTGPKSEKNLIPSNGSAFTFPAEPPHSFPPP